MEIKIYSFLTQYYLLRFSGLSSTLEHLSIDFCREVIYLLNDIKEASQIECNLFFKLDNFEDVHTEFLDRPLDTQTSFSLRKMRSIHKFSIDTLSLLICNTAHAFIR